MAIAAGPAQVPAPATADRLDPVERSGGVASWWTACGARAHIRFMPETKRVSIAMLIAGGAVLERREERGLTEAAAWSWTRPEVADEVPPGREDELGPGSRRNAVRVEGCPEGVLIRANVAPERLEAALRAIGAMLREPRCDATRLERWRERSLKMLEARAGSVEHQIASAIMDVLVPDEVPGEGKPLPAEAIAAMRLERAQAWLVDRILTSPMEIAVAGPIVLEGAAGEPDDAAGGGPGKDGSAAERTLRRLIDDIFAGLPERERISPLTFAERRVAHRVVGPTSEQVRLPIPAGTAHVIAGFSGPDIGALEDVRALYLAAEVAKRRLDGLCGDGKLPASMCAARLMPARMHPGLGAMFLTTRVSDSDEAIGGARAALDRLLADLVERGPREEEVVAAGAALADDAERRLAEPDYWAACLSISTIQGLSPTGLLEAPTAYRSMSAQRVREIVTNWCVPANRFSLTVRPVGP